VTDPANPGQPYGGQPGQPYGGQPAQPYGQPPAGQPGQPGHYGPPAPGQPDPGHYGPPAQQPFGAPPPGNPYGGAEFPAPNPYGAIPPPPAKKKTGRIVGIIVGAVVVVLVLCVGGIIAVNYIGKNNASNAKVGDCLEGDSMKSTTAQRVNHVKIVDCGASTANYKVVGIVKDKTETDFDTNQDICKAFPSAQFGLWQGTSGSSGDVLCLEPKS
jgi:hypothetical protein